MVLALPFRMMIRKVVSAIALVLLFGSIPASAAGLDDASAAAPAIPVSTAMASPRPDIIPSLYVSLAALQAYDGYSTIRGIRNGAREVNPIVGNAAGQPIAMWTLKAASTATTIYYAERLWRQHRRGQAITLLVVANAMMGAVAAHNASVISSLR